MTWSDLFLLGCIIGIYSVGVIQGCVITARNYENPPREVL